MLYGIGGGVVGAVVYKSAAELKVFVNLLSFFVNLLAFLSYIFTL